MLKSSKQAATANTQFNKTKPKNKEIARYAT